MPSSGWAVVGASVAVLGCGGSGETFLSAAHCHVLLFEDEGFRDPWQVLTGGGRRPVEPAGVVTGVVVEGQHCVAWPSCAEGQVGPVLTEGYHPLAALQELGLSSATVWHIDVDPARPQPGEYCSVVLYQSDTFGGHSWSSEPISISRSGWYSSLDFPGMSDNIGSLRVVGPLCAVTVYEDDDFWRGARTFFAGWHPAAELRRHGLLARISSLVVHAQPLYLDDHDHLARPHRHHVGGTVDPYAVPRVLSRGERFDPASGCFQVGENVGQKLAGLTYWAGYVAHSGCYVPIVLVETARLYMHADVFAALAFPFQVLKGLLFHISSIVLWVLHVAYGCLLHLTFGPLSFVELTIQASVSDAVQAGASGSTAPLMVGVVLVISLAYAMAKLGHRRFALIFIGVMALVLVMMVIRASTSSEHGTFLFVEAAQCLPRLSMGWLIGSEDALAYWFALFSFSTVDLETSHHGLEWT